MAYSVRSPYSRFQGVQCTNYGLSARHAQPHILKSAQKYPSMRRIRAREEDRPPFRGWQDVRETIQHCCEGTYRPNSPSARDKMQWGAKGMFRPRLFEPRARVHDVQPHGDICARAKPDMALGRVVLSAHPRQNIPAIKMQTTKVKTSKSTSTTTTFISRATFPPAARAELVGYPHIQPRAADLFEVLRELALTPGAVHSIWRPQSITCTWTTRSS